MIIIPDLVVVDVETTGMSPGKHRVIEVAAVRIRDGREIRRLSTLAQPLSVLPRFITEFTGITDAMLKGAPLFEDVAEILWNFMDGAVFCAHNAGFDAKFLRSEFSLWGSIPPILDENAPLLCTVKLGRRLFPKLPNHRLDTVARYVGVKDFNRHRALGDALAASEIIITCLKILSARGLKNMDEIIKFQRSRIPRAKKGKTSGAIYISCDEFDETT